MIGAVVTWVAPAMLALLTVWGAGYVWGIARRRRRGDKMARPVGGSLGFDDVWRPSAAEAQVVWEAEQITPIPAPTPDLGPGVIEGDRIVIEASLGARGTTPAIEPAAQTRAAGRGWLVRRAQRPAGGSARAGCYARLRP